MFDAAKSFFASNNSISICIALTVITMSCKIKPKINNRKNTQAITKLKNSYSTSSLKNGLVLEAEHERADLVKVKLRSSAGDETIFADFGDYNGSISWNLDDLDFPMGVYEIKVIYGVGSTTPSTLVINNNNRIDLNLSQNDEQDGGIWHGLFTANG